LTQTRIAFIDMPRMLREIVDDALAKRPGVRLVDETKDDGDLLAVADRSGAQCLIVSSETVGAVEVCRLLEQRPRVRVFAIDGAGRDGCLYELRPNLALVGQLSPQSLARAVLGERSSQPAELDAYPNRR
jgi:hypothetical protein